jgi:hypothetical protein
VGASRTPLRDPDRRRTPGDRLRRRLRVADGAVRPTV